MMLIKFTFYAFLLLSGRQEEKIQPHVTTYIEAHKYLAIDEMLRTGIPASVTMAQAILESNAGVSKLAKVTNNHFGIKCKSYWEGSAYYHPDDDRDASGNLIPSCFRKYESVEASYMDHSNFLMQTNNYLPLFGYDKTEFEKWAEGLEICGYATDEKYAEKIINTIKLYDLHELDYYTVQYVEKSSVQQMQHALSEKK